MSLTEKQRLAQNEASRKYRRTAKGRATTARHNHSKKHKASTARYNKSAKHAECQRRYRQAGKEAMAKRKYHARPDIQAKCSAREHLRHKNLQTTRTETRNGDKCEVTIYGLDEPIRNDQELIAKSGMDMTRWKMVGFDNKTYSAWIKNADGKIETKQLWSAHGRYELNKERIAAQAWVEEYINLARKHSPIAYRAMKSPKRESGNLLTSNLTDHHLAKLAWPQETGGAAYDMKIAVDVWKKGIESQIQRAKSFDIERVLMVFGNDMCHFDNRNNTTFRGTPQDADSRYRKMIYTAQELLVWTVDAFLSIAPVDGVVMPGNHDEESSLHLADFLKAWYRHSKNVSVENSPLHRKYVQWGKVLLGFAHGDSVKLTDLSRLMAVEKPDLWAQCPIREWHTGDKHQRKTIEDHGVGIHILPTLCPPDDWHARQGYVGNMRMTQSFIYNKQEGEVGRFTYTYLEDRKWPGPR